MAIIYISAALFLIMLLFPILFSLVSLTKNSGEVMKIDNSKIKDPRYFVKSFTALFDKGWKSYDGSGKITLSREENIIEADIFSVFPPICDSIVYAEYKDFRPHEGVCFDKEIYAQQNAYLYNIEAVRAVCSKKDLYIGTGTRVFRWADAEGVLTASDDCELGISASSATKIILGNNCRFRRLYAPIILFGQPSQGEETQDSRNNNVELKPEALRRVWNIKYVNDDLTDDDGVFTGSIITTHSITVLNNLTVKGHIRSHKSVRLCDNAAVYGNIFAEGDVHLGQNARVYGSVFTQGNFHAESGTVIGQSGKTKSVVVRGKITFDKNCTVYGFVSTETSGQCIPDIYTGKSDRAVTRFLSGLHPGESFLQKKSWTVAISIAAIFSVFTASIYTASILQKVQGQSLHGAKNAAAVKPIYGAYGKPDEEPLAAEPMVVTDDYVYFKDRVLERFHYDAGSISQGTEILKSMMAFQPKDVNKYLMLIPMRINLENDIYRQYTDDAKSAIDDIYGSMPSDVTTLDAFSPLYGHRDEYLFFRTDFRWTSLGAYYAAGEFCRSAGIDMKDIKEYHEDHLEGYLGVLRELPYSQALKDYPDYISYYTLKGAVNEQTITARTIDKKYITYKSPAVAVSRRGAGIFIGSVFSHSILHGDEKNGKTLLIVGDDYGKAFAPWLTPYYENVILVNPDYFDGGYEQFRNLFLEYKVTDFLILESVRDLKDNNINNEMIKLYLKP